MSLLMVKTHDLTHQDRTMNVEIMTAPIRAQLLHNKHKGLSTKYRQYFNNLERERISFLRSHTNETRMMERRKERYAKSRNDIFLRRMSGDSRRNSMTSLDNRQLSAPPRLKTEKEVTKGVFLTHLPNRDIQTADVPEKGRQTGSRNIPPRTPLFPAGNQHPVTALTPTVTPVNPAKPGTAHLRREKSVRFLNIQTHPNGQLPPEVTEPAKPTAERVKRFLDNQVDFNNRKPEVRYCQSPLIYGSEPHSPSAAKREAGLKQNMDRLECAFDEFCSDGSKAGFQKLVRYASKMRVYVKAL